MTEIEAIARFVSCWTFMGVFALVYYLGQPWIRRAPK